MQEGFLTQSTELEKEARASIKGTSDLLDGQDERVDQLQGRMKVGKEKVVELGVRLDQVKRRLEEAENRDGEQRKRLGRRVKMMFSCFGFWMAILTVGVILRHWGFRPGVMPEVTKDLMEEASSQLLAETNSVSETVASITTKAPPEKPPLSTAKRKEASTGSMDAAATLRLLDEL